MSKRIFVGNLPWSVGFEKLKELFEPYGKIENAIVMSDKQTKKSRGFGFVTFVDEDNAKKAIADMNKKNIEGRELTVNEAQERIE